MSESAAIRVALAGPEALPALAARFAGWCDAAERARHARLARPADRTLYAASHALLRIVLARATGTPPERLDFRREPGGRPVLAGHARPWFSLSHSGGRILIACSDLCPVGADLEAAPRVPPSPALIDAIAGAEEAEWLRAAAPAGALERALLALWVVKEATVKLTGEGLACDPRALRTVAAREWCEVRDLRRPATSGAAACVRLLDLDWAGAAAIAVPPRHAHALARIAIERGGDQTPREQLSR